MDTSNILSAVNAYRNQMKMMQGADDATPEATQAAPGGSFSQMLEDAGKGFADTQYKAEALEMQSLNGKVNLTDLVTAVTDAGLTLNTVVAIRDRVISAYQSIMGMSI